MESTVAQFQETEVFLLQCSRLIKIRLQNFHYFLSYFLKISSWKYGSISVKIRFGSSIDKLNEVLSSLSLAKCSNRG